MAALEMRLLLLLSGHDLVAGPTLGFQNLARRLWCRASAQGRGDASGGISEAAQGTVVQGFCNALDDN